MSQIAPLRVLPDLDLLSHTVADHFADLVSHALEKQEQFTVALAGGNTPRGLYRDIATRFGKKLPWSQIHFFWGDERYVAKDDSLSNFRLAREALLDHIDIPASNIH